MLGFTDEVRVPTQLCDNGARRKNGGERRHCQASAVMLAADEMHQARRTGMAEQPFTALLPPLAPCLPSPIRVPCYRTEPSARASEGESADETPWSRASFEITARSTGFSRKYAALSRSAACRLSSSG